MTPESTAARVWLVRERTEHEAAALFAQLARDLASCAAPDHLVALAARCGADELVHAQHCREIVGELDPTAAPLRHDASITLGPPGAGPPARALYASVALGCVTESLSTALLIALRPRASRAVVRRALDVILEDEVRHSRLGWAVLAHVASREDVRWLQRHVPAMLHAALDGELPPATGGAPESLAAFGILDRDEVRRICEQTIESTITPGLARYGIDVR